MAVVVQTANIVEADAYFTNATPSIFDIAVTVSAGSNLGVFLVLNCPASTFTSGGWNTPTLDGVDMVEVFKQSAGANSANGVWYALAPSAGAHTVRLSTPTYSAMRVKATVIPMANVHQTTPVGTYVSYSSGGSSSPTSSSVTVDAGGVAIAGHTVNADTEGSLTPGAGQTLCGTVGRMFTTVDMAASYKAGATAMSFSWTGGALQNAQLVVPVKPAADAPAATANITTDDAVFAGSAQPGASTAAGMAITTDAAVFNGSAGTVPGVITTTAFKNNTGAVQAGLTGLTVALLRFSDFALAGVLTGQTTNGAGILSMTTQLATPGVEYLVVTRNAAGTAIGAEKYTAA